MLVMDHAAKAGRKLAISGGGKCNFTNLDVSPEHYLSRNPHFCKSALARFKPTDFLKILARHKVRYFEKEAGQLFCSEGADRIVSIMEQECREAGADILLQCRVEAVDSQEGFIINTSHGRFQCASLIIATGGLSHKLLGATGFGYEVARQFGLTVIAPRPALVPLTFSATDRANYQELSGISFDASVAVGEQSIRGNILFTHRGLSGPAILDSSLFWTPGKTIAIDQLPGVNFSAHCISKKSSPQELVTILSGFLPKRLAQKLCKLNGITGPVSNHSDNALKEAAEAIHGWKIKPAGTAGWAIAEVTAGGVATEELSSKTMEAKKITGLFFIGEVMDVTGRLGGYNLHWAWASAYAASQFA